MELPPSLARTIRERRAELGLTQQELADRIGYGMRQSDVSRLERGRVVLPRRERLEHVAAALEIPLGQLLARSGWIGADRVLEPAPTPLGRDGSPPALAPMPPAPPPSPPAVTEQARGANQPRPIPRGGLERLWAALERAHELELIVTETHQRALRTYQLAAEGMARPRTVDRRVR